jgi:tellurite resistance protein TerC
MFMSGLLALAVFAALTWLDLRNLHPKRPELPWGNILNFNLLWLLVAAAIVLEFTLQDPNAWLATFFKKTETANAWTLAAQFGIAFLVQKSLTQGAFILAACRMSRFEVSYKGQMRLVFWASLGMILMRLVLQAWEWKLVSMAGWFVYALTPFLFYYGFLLLHTRHDSFSLEEHPLLNAVNKFLPLSESITVPEPTGLNGAEQKSRERAKIDEIFFFKRKQEVLHMTPLFSLLLVVLSVFLLCSFSLLPAVWAITQDHSVIFLSNLASILGLGSGYLWSAKNLHRLRHLKRMSSF